MDYDQQLDIVYGYKDGMALIMDAYIPKSQCNGGGVIWVAAGGWESNYEKRKWALDPDPDNPDLAQLNNFHSVSVLLHALLRSGYVVFSAQHSSQPKYTIDDIRPDIPRAVRFVRHHAERFGIDPQRIGVMGCSSGGHISLMTATAPPAPDADAEDPVERESSAVQAAAVYMPPTDLRNVGGDRVNAQEFINGYLSQNQLGLMNAPFDFHGWDDEKQRFERIADPEQRTEYFRCNSPIEYLSRDTPPILLLHGDQDPIVPLQQSKRLVVAMEMLCIAHKLVVFPGLEHAMPAPPNNGQKDVLDWLDRHLLNRNT
ncbi:MAG: alpha/beta fold hydrolase [Candidatus Latescibacteria bacterium]|nr:alpha/beta fold hydrolase [Candidatus Latescibacterota bacterium]